MTAIARTVLREQVKDVLTQCWKSLGVEGRITLTLYGTQIEPEEAAELHVPLLEAIRSANAPLAGREARKHVEFFAKLARRRGTH